MTLATRLAKAAKLKKAADDINNGGDGNLNAVKIPDNLHNYESGGSCFINFRKVDREYYNDCHAAAEDFRKVYRTNTGGMITKMLTKNWHNPIARTQTRGDDAKGGYATTDGFDRVMIRQLMDDKALPNLVSRRAMAQETIFIPAEESTNTAKAALVPEAGAIPEVEFNLTQRKLVAQKWAGRTVVSSELENDWEISPGLMDWLGGLLSGQLVNRMEDILVAGTRSGAGTYEHQRGLMSEAKAANVSNFRKVLEIAGYTGGTPDFDISHIRKLKNGLVSADAARSIWLCDDDLLDFLQTLHDPEGRYIYRDPTETTNIGLPANARGFLAGRPVYTTADIPSVAAAVGAVPAGKAGFLFLFNPQILELGQMEGTQVDQDRSGKYFDNDTVCIRVKQRFGSELKRPQGGALIVYQKSA